MTVVGMGEGWGKGGGREGEVVRLPTSPPAATPGGHANPGGTVSRQEGSGSGVMLPVAEEVVRSIGAAPTASPAPVAMGGGCLSRPVDYRTG